MKNSKTVSFRLTESEKRIVAKLAFKQGVSEAKFLENIVKPYIREYSNNLTKARNEDRSGLVAMAIENSIQNKRNKDRSGLAELATEL